MKIYYEDGEVELSPGQIELMFYVPRKLRLYWEDVLEQNEKESESEA